MLGEVEHHRLEAVAHRRIAHPVMVGVVPGEGHLPAGGGEVPVIARARVWVVVQQQVVLQAVQDDVPDDVGRVGSAESLACCRLVYREVDGLPDVDVVEGRDRQVHRDVPKEVPGLDHDAAQRRIRAIPVDLRCRSLGVRAGVHDQVERPVIQLCRVRIQVAAQQELDPVRVRRAEGVGTGSPRRVADQDQGLARNVSRHHRGGFQPVRTFDHVRTRGDQERPVPVVVPCGHAERSGGIGRVRRDGRRGGQGEQLTQVTFRVGQVHDEQMGVRSLQAADRTGGARGVVVEPGDHRVVERVPALGRFLVRLPVQGPDDVGSRDLHLLQGRSVVEARPQVERPGEPVGREGRKRRRQVGSEDGAAVGGVLSVVGDQGPQEAATERLPGVGEVVLLRVQGLGRRERRSAEHGHADPQGAAHRVPPDRGGRGGPGCAVRGAGPCREGQHAHRSERPPQPAHEPHLRCEGCGEEARNGAEHQPGRQGGRRKRPNAALL